MRQPIKECFDEFSEHQFAENLVDGSKATLCSCLQLVIFRHELAAEAEEAEEANIRRRRPQPQSHLVP